MLKRLLLVVGVCLLIGYGPGIWRNIQTKLPPPQTAAEAPIALDEQPTPVRSFQPIEIAPGSGATRDNLEGFSPSAQLSTEMDNLVEVIDQHTSTTYVSFVIRADGGFQPATRSCFIDHEGNVYCDNIKYAHVHDGLVSVTDALPGHTYLLTVRTY